MREAISGQMKERQDLERKMQSQARRADHLERARREEEGPLLLAAYNTRLQVRCPPPASTCGNTNLIHPVLLPWPRCGICWPRCGICWSCRHGSQPILCLPAEGRVMQLVISLVLNPDLPTRPQEDEVQHKAAMEERERQHRAEWEVAIAEKQRLAVMRDEEAGFRKAIMDRRAAEFQALRVSLAAAVFFRAHLQRLALVWGRIQIAYLCAHTTGVCKLVFLGKPPSAAACRHLYM